MNGVSYYMYKNQNNEETHATTNRWHEQAGTWCSPSESFSLYSFWLGRESDALLEWPPESKPAERDFSFLYGG